MACASAVFSPRQELWTTPVCAVALWIKRPRPRSRHPPNALSGRRREAAAQLLVPPPPKERALPVRPRPAEAGEAGSTSSTPEKVTNGVALGGVAHEEVADSQEVLVGICSSIALRDLNLIDALLAQLEQMEEQGVVTPANHVGKREILVPEPH